MVQHSVSADHQMPDLRTWAELTASEAKRSSFALDLYFRSAWADLVVEFGPGASAAVGQLALLSFKCDGLVGRRIGRTLDYVHEHGFAEVSYGVVRQTRHSVRELWRYNWDVYPTDRLSLMSLMHTRTDVLMVLLRDLRHDGSVPASVRIADLKGPAVAARRRPEHLRSVLDPPNAVINFVHVADEPADVIRELGIFLGGEDRRRVIADAATHLAAAITVPLDQVVADLEARFPARDLDVARALDRVEASGAVPASQWRRIRAAADGGPWITWRELTDAIPPASPSVDVWDLICIATATLPEVREGTSDLLPSITPAEWIASRQSALGTS